MYGTLLHYQREENTKNRISENIYLMRRNTAEGGERNEDTAKGGETSNILSYPLRLGDLITKTSEA